MDPWKDCERLFDPHFLQRMSERHLPREHVEKALEHVDRIREKNQTFKIKWNKWTLLVDVGECFLTLKTAIRG